MNEVTTTHPVQRPPLASRDLADVIRFCMSAAERDGQGKLALRNMPSQQNRQLLAARMRVLLESFKQHDRKEIAIAIMDMLASYDVAQARQMTTTERKAAATLYVRELAGVPTWAVQEACNRIRLGNAPDISHHYKPTPIQVRVLAAKLAAPWKNEALQIGEILNAPQYVEGPSEKERQRVGVKMQTLADDLKEVVAERRKEQDAAVLQRFVDGSQREIERQWASLGTAPPKFQISVTLARQIEKRRRQDAEAPF